MEEYEYSLKARAVEPFLEYCKKNNYEATPAVRQNRKVYENKFNKHIIARLTTEEIKGEEITFFDSKNVGQENDNLKISSESEPLKINKEDIETIKSILDVMGFYQSADNYRTRYVYHKDGVKFEIDDYTITNMKVVAIEGERSEVEKVYKEVVALGLDKR